MEDLKTTDTGNVTEEVNTAPQKAKSSASDLLSRLNRNITETPKSGLKFTTGQTVESASAPEQPTADIPSAEEYSVDESVISDVADDIAAIPDDDMPMINTFEVNEAVYDEPPKSDRREYKLKVKNRAKNTVLPENEQPQIDVPQYQQPQYDVPMPDDSLDTLEPMATEYTSDSELPEAVRDRYAGMETPETKRPRRRRANEQAELQRRIEDAENYVREMQTGEISIPQTDVQMPQNVRPDGDLDETDMNLMIAFGMEEELRSKVGDERAEKLTETIDRSTEDIDERMIETGEEKKKKQKPAEEYFEFTDQEQVKPIFKRYKDEYANMLLRLMSIIILAAVTFFYENIEIFGGALPPMLNSTSYPVVHVLIGLQLVLIGGVLIYRKLWDGLNELLKMKPTQDSLLVVMMAVAIIYHIILCFVDVYSGVRLYNFPLMIMILLELLYEFNMLKQEMFSFNVAGSKKPKYTIDRVPDEESVLEREAFAEMLPESPVMFRIGKVKFVDGFFKRTKYTPIDKKPVGIILPIVGAIALIFFAAGFAISRSFYTGLQLGYMTLMLAMPLSIFVTYSYPFYTASKAAHTAGGAIVGECSLDEYDKASVISFDDIDVFPQSRVKLKTVKTFGNSRIDTVIFDAKCIFVALGGPLADVFTTATEIDVATGGPVEVLNIADNGIEAMLGTKHILVGKGEFLRAYGFEPINPREDENLENGGDITVMYMVADNEIVAKYYLQYRIDPDFDFMLTQLYKSGMCVGIRTLDPNISDFMLSTRVKISKFAVKVLKYHEPFPKRERFERTESGIISKSGAKSLLMTLALCDKVQHIIRTNLVVTIFAMIISFIIMAFVLTLGIGDSAMSIYVALYQAFWIVPMVIIAKLFI